MTLPHSAIILMASQQIVIVVVITKRHKHIRTLCYNYNMATSASSSSSAASVKSDTPAVLEKVVTPIVSLDRIRVVSFKDSDKAADCLIQAFAEDEVARYFIDTDDMAKYDAQAKWKLHCEIMRYITAAHCLDGLVTAVGDDEDEFGAVALW